MAEVNANSMERPSDLGKSSQAVVKRWKLELKLADKRESAWRKKVTEIYRLYTPETPAANSFNILWSNTETLRQSVYNSLPQPDARRRYSDEDPLGKAVGEVLTRSLEFAQDTYDFDAVLKADVLSMLLAGRAVARVRYVPEFRAMEGETPEAVEGESPEANEYEEIAWEQVICERIQWDDFRILCAAKTWDEVTAIGFRHRFTREDLIEKFGEEIGNKVPLDSADDEDVKKSKEIEDLFKTAEVWEIWDKDEKQVLFIASGYPVPCKEQADPLKLCGFFPIPRPLYAIENDTSLLPATLYTQYEQQAKELNRVSTRINKLVDALRVRGIYDATLDEMAELMKRGDNELLPAKNVTALLERGGLEKAIWMMPIETAAAVLKELQLQRDATKQVIYEITGISDIMRSASDPKETFGAQRIKTQWGTQRLQRMQRETQRYIRDLIRLKAEIISSKFQPETLEQMTLVKLPHQAEIDAQKMQMMQQYQQASMQAQQAGQQPPPPPPQQPDPITWEAVVQAMRNDATRTYRIDIETDSTLSATQDADMQGMKELLSGLAAMIQGFGPAVQAGAIPMDVVKSIMMAITRRAKMGSIVEDAIDKMPAQMPPMKDPHAAKAQADAQAEQAKTQATMQIEQMKAQLADQQHQRELMANNQASEAEAQRAMQMEQWKQTMQAQQVQHQNELEAQRELQRQQLEAAAEERRQMLESAANERELQFNQWKAELENSTKIAIAELQAKTTLKTSAMSANASSGATEFDEEGNGKPNSTLSAMVDGVNEKIQGLLDLQQTSSKEMMQKHAELVTHLTRKKKVVRDENNRIVGVE